MSHHKRIIIGGIDYGHFRITNDGEIISIWIRQPWGVGEVFLPDRPPRDAEDELV